MIALAYMAYLMNAHQVTSMQEGSWATSTRC